MRPSYLSLSVYPTQDPSRMMYTELSLKQLKVKERWPFCPVASARVVFTSSNQKPVYCVLWEELWLVPISARQLLRQGWKPSFREPPTRFTPNTAECSDAAVAFTAWHAPWVPSDKNQFRQDQPLNLWDLAYNENISFLVHIVLQISKNSIPKITADERVK